MKILLTNRLNIIGVFITVFLYTLIYNCVIDDGVTRNLFQSIIAAFLFLFLYGIIFLIAFLIALIFLDLILIIPNQKNLKIKLLLEWFIVSIPFVYLATIYERQRVIYLVAVVTFFITQLLREKLIKRIVG